MLDKLKKGDSIALVSDSGTPVINDPGYHLVRKCRKEGIYVIPLPGACAAITALSASGLPSDRFCYEGFLPSKKQDRIERLQRLALDPRTLIFYDSKYRILDSLQDIMTIFGPKRYVVIARELTKRWESIKGGPVNELLSWVQEDRMRSVGEIVLIIDGNRIKVQKLEKEVLRTMKIFISYDFSVKTAAQLTGEIHSINKNIIYREFIKNFKNKKNN